MGKSFTNYYGLIFGCPVGNELAGCGFKKIRQHQIKERLVYYNTMAESKKMILIEAHQHCLSVREKKTLFHESQ
jgi:hypothetical protein